METHSYKLIKLPTNKDQRGSLTFVEGAQDVPFHIKRIYYLHGSQQQHKRGMHAHTRLKQVLIAIAGSFDVIVDDGKGRKILKMNDPTIGLLISGMVWRELVNFSNGSICLVLASEHYDGSDYIHDYTAFKQTVVKSFK